MDKPITKDPARHAARNCAMKAIGDTKWYPKSGQNRIGAHGGRTVPTGCCRASAPGACRMAIFVNKASGKVLNDPGVNQRIVEAFKAEGADAWFNSPPSRFLGNDLDPNDFEQVNDILDVWFDSGSTHVFTVEQPLEPEWPQKDHADLYLEGSDQHRGWFQSSLLESCATRGRAPYEAVLTAGFVLDREGNKMSKSIGNTILPQTIADKNGADIFRLWVASSDFTEDLRMGNDIIKANVGCLSPPAQHDPLHAGQLSGFDEAERIAPEKMPELERFMLAKLAELDGIVRDGYMRIRLQPRAATPLFNLLHQRAVGLLFRYPQGFALLRRQGQHPPPLRAHGDGRNVPPRRHLACADPVLHDGRSLAAALPRRGARACTCTPSRQRRRHGRTPR